MVSLGLSDAAALWVDDGEAMQCHSMKVGQAHPQQFLFVYNDLTRGEKAGEACFFRKAKML